MRRIGIFCGTFDPVHLGHLRVAQAALMALQLERVLFIPIAQPLTRRPHASIKHRAAMLAAAIQDLPGMQLADSDLCSLSPYAVDAVGLLTKRFPDAQLIYLAGADKLPDIPGWKQAFELFASCIFAVYPRAGSAVEPWLTRLQGAGAQAVLLQGEPWAISGGQVRGQLRLLSDAPGRLPKQVAAYIAAHGLYQPDYERMLQHALSPARLAHSQRVRLTAVRLAMRHGLNMQKAGVAGILHDCAKNMELGRLQAIAQRARLNLGPEVLASNALLHGPAGAQVARLRYHISDADILNAIRYHTTGRAGMSELELLIYLADAIEPGRDYPGAARLRRLAEKDLQRAALCSLLEVKRYVKAKGFADSPLTGQALADLLAHNNQPETSHPVYAAGQAARRK